MLVTLITTTGAIVAIVAAVAAGWQAGLVRKQVLHEKDLATATLYQSIAGQFIQIDAFFVDHPRLRPYFYDDLALPVEDELRSQVLATAEMVFDLAESCHATARVLGDRARDWDKYFGLLYRNSPVLRAYAADYAHYYPDEVRAAFSSASPEASYSDDVSMSESAGESTN